MNKNDFLEMIKDWKADNNEYEEIIIDEIELINDKWTAIVYDRKYTYQLTNEKGCININYIGCK